MLVCTHTHAYVYVCEGVLSNDHALSRSAPHRSEEAIAAIAPRPGLPAELVTEVDQIRVGLLTLRQNVVLLRDGDDSNAYYRQVAACRVGGAPPPSPGCPPPRPTPIITPAHSTRAQRIGLTETSSFMELSASWQQVLEELHDEHFYRRQVGARTGMRSAPMRREGALGQLPPGEWLAECEPVSPPPKRTGCPAPWPAW